MKRRPTFLITMLAFGFAFFYIPILSMIVYSFNASRLATVWGGFSTKWYVALFSNDKVIEALILSLKIAFVSATIATLLGTMSGIVLARYTKFRGRTLFSGLVTAPLIMPEVITGISLLIFFILLGNWIGWPVCSTTVIPARHCHRQRPLAPSFWSVPAWARFPPGPPRRPILPTTADCRCVG